MKKGCTIFIAMVLTLICMSGLAEIKAPLKIQLEGEWYEMPCEVSEFLKNGWNLIDPDNQNKAVDVSLRVPTGDVGELLKRYILTRQGKVANISLKNEHMKEWAIEGCVVSEIHVGVWDNNQARLSCEGVEYGVTTLKKLPAWAKEVYNEQYGCTYFLNDYDANYHGRIQVFSNDDKVVDYMSVSAEHYGPTEDALKELDGYTEYVPGEFDNYKKPKRLDDDWTTGTILLDGELYQMPIPVRTLIKDGWEVVEDTWVMPGDTEYCTLIKGDLELFVQVHNIMVSKDKGEQPAKLYNCEVDTIFAMPADRSYFKVGKYENGMTRNKMLSHMHSDSKIQLNEKESDEESEFYEGIAIFNKNDSLDTKNPEYSHATYEMQIIAKDEEVTEIKVGYSPYYSWKYE